MRFGTPLSFDPERNSERTALPLLVSESASSSFPDLDLPPILRRSMKIGTGFSLLESITSRTESSTFAGSGLVSSLSLSSPSSEAGACFSAAEAPLSRLCTILKIPSSSFSTVEAKSGSWPIIGSFSRTLSSIVSYISSTASCLSSHDFISSIFFRSSWIVTCTASLRRRDISRRRCPAYSLGLPSPGWLGRGAGRSRPAISPSVGTPPPKTLTLSTLTRVAFPGRHSSMSSQVSFLSHSSSGITHSSSQSRPFRWANSAARATWRSLYSAAADFSSPSSRPDAESPKISSKSPPAARSSPPP
mmetsp:Transcript_25318/g.60194  ORF Transcript_25318/g.60194 Transcript_25318/m.60194 type:complete len:303 (+) Transcript_25318:834-1742(+)